MTLVSTLHSIPVVNFVCIHDNTSPPPHPAICNPSCENGGTCVTPDNCTCPPGCTGSRHMLTRWGHVTVYGCGVCTELATFSSMLLPILSPHVSTTSTFPNACAATVHEFSRIPSLQYHHFECDKHFLFPSAPWICMSKQPSGDLACINFGVNVQ